MKIESCQLNCGYEPLWPRWKLCTNVRRKVNRRMLVKSAEESGYLRWEMRNLLVILKNAVVIKWLFFFFFFFLNVEAYFFPVRLLSIWIIPWWFWRWNLEFWVIFVAVIVDWNRKASLGFCVRFQNWVGSQHVFTTNEMGVEKYKAWLWFWLWRFDVIWRWKKWEPIWNDSEKFLIAIGIQGFQEFSQKQHFLVLRRSQAEPGWFWGLAIWQMAKCELISLISPWKRWWNEKLVSDLVSGRKGEDFGTFKRWNRSRWRFRSETANADSSQCSGPVRFAQCPFFSRCMMMNQSRISCHF